MRRIIKTILRILACLIPSRTLRHKIRDLVPGETYENIKFTDKRIAFLKEHERDYPDNIMSVEETVRELLENGKSCARIGDGEFLLMMGDENVWGNRDPELSKRLLEICAVGSTDSCLVCINPYGLYNTNCWFCFYYLRTIEKIKKKIKFNPNCMYGDAYVFWYYVVEQIRFEILRVKRKPELRIKTRNLERIKNLWNKKDVVFVVNKNSPCISDKLNIFSKCKSKKFVFVPERNSYSEYDRILSDIKKHSKKHVVYLECGETATVLAWDLAQAGYRALDLGSFYTRIQNACK